MDQEMLGVRCKRIHCIHNIKDLCGYNGTIDINENGCTTYCNRSHEDVAKAEMHELIIKLKIYNEDQQLSSIVRCANNVASIAQQMIIGRENEPKGDGDG